MGDFDRSVVTSVAHRPWPMPARPWIMTQTWRDLLFAHWAVDPRIVRAMVPAVFELDLFEGQAWIGVVPFLMSNVSLRGVPSLPGVSAFPELNVRTYVRVGDRRGVYFFSLDAGATAPVMAARWLLNLPYFRATMAVTVTPASHAGASVAYASTRRAQSAEFQGTYGPIGPAASATAGTLEHFLVERYCLYHVDARGRPYRLELHHPPWALQAATARITRNTMAAASGLSLPGDPDTLHFAARQDVVAWKPEPIAVPTYGGPGLQPGTRGLG